MVSEGNRTGLYVILPVYFTLLLVASLLAYRRTIQMKNKKKTDMLSVHYLGGRSLGPILSAGSMFASIFSGYTVSGIPNEAFRTGWMSLRWMPMALICVVGFMGTGLRLRKAGLLRNHSSPVDFITDRYQSQMLRYIIVFLQILPAIIYLAAQVIAIQKTFNNTFGFDPSEPLPTILIMAFILAFECIGGLSTVAITDTIQAFVLGFGFIFIPIVIKMNFGGWSDLDPETYPKPQFYQTPSTASQWSFWQFSLVNISFFTLPHIMQRVYAAKDVKSMKAGYAILTFGTFLNFISAVFIGTVGVALLTNSDGSPMKTNDAFSDILEMLMDLGGFAEITACIALTASLAAIMSTADSLIIAISQLVTVEIVRPALSKFSSKDRESHLVWYGRASSLLAVVVALVVGLLYSGNLTDLTRIQFPLSTQALPAFMFGLFSYNQRTDIHPWNISIGAIAGVASVFGIYFGHLKANADALPLNPGIIGLLLNVFAIFLAESLRRLLGKTTASKDDDYYLETTRLLYPDRPSWDIPNVQERYGENTLTPQLMWKSMEGVKEPLTNWSWIVLIFVAISYVTPMTAELEPRLDDSGVFSPSNLPQVVNGLPWWAFKIIMATVASAAILYASIYQLPNAFPTTEEEEKSAGLLSNSLAPSPPMEAFASVPLASRQGSRVESDTSDAEEDAGELDTI